MKQGLYKSVLVVFFALIACPVASAQVGIDTDIWTWTESADHHQSIVEIQSGVGTGTGVIISVDTDKAIKDGFEGYCLTAWHVVQEDNNEGKIRVRFANGRKSKGCRVAQYDEARDVALIWVWVPDDVKPATLATRSIEGGDALELVGLGGGSTLDRMRHFSATASPPSSGEKIFADVPLLPGDSGGPVFNSDHEVVGIISGGWFWYDSGVTTESGSEIKTTWPARASNVGPIQSLLDKVYGTDIADAGMTLDR